MLPSTSDSELRLFRQAAEKLKALHGTEAWQPRDYQRPVYDYLKNGGKRAVAVWHRRAGKDATSLHWTVEAAQKRVGVYWHMLPTMNQGRKVIWNGIGKDGKKFIDAWPKEAKRRSMDMQIELPNGSLWQVVGSDNYNALVGANPVGVVFSEYSLADPAAWDFIRPILAENGGWALFIYTPRGRNHGHSLYTMAQRNPDWFCERLTVDDTNSIPLSAIEEERKAGMSEEMIQQEFYCSFEAPLQGSYYGRLMMEAEKEGRIGNVPHDPAVPVETWWDLGKDDATAIWFAQRVGKEIHLIDYYENSGEQVAHYANVLAKKREERRFVYSTHYLPHDAKAEPLAAAKSVEGQLYDLGIRNLEVLPRDPKALQETGGIEAVRVLLPKCWFDMAHCERGVLALRSYRKAPQPENLWASPTEPTYKDHPLHDWSSHGADAFRTGAMAKEPRVWGGPLQAPMNHPSRALV